VPGRRAGVEVGASGGSISFQEEGEAFGRARLQRAGVPGSGRVEIGESLATSSAWLKVGAVHRREGRAMAKQGAKERRKADLRTPSDLSNSAQDIEGALNACLADSFALFLKTKNFHWHVSGPQFRDYHLLLDEQAAQILAATDDMAERVRKVGGTTIRSIGHIARLQRLSDNDADFVTPEDMLAELREDNRQMVANLREAHGLCDEAGDVATASLIENWIDEAERRVWFLFEATRRA
jgi:starvation-inducible DNA-binding protein